METNFWGKIATFVNVRGEIDIDAAGINIRKNIHFRGMTVFILACAIIIASVGLNLNSIPVIIGAMLISPVMGPILGFGLGLATNDTTLLKDALKNFLIMVGISIVASAIYFLLSPLSPSQKTELLARTNPTVYDVLIALFGGAAGMFATSKKEGGSTVIPGVAIATALMPPLCTVGYGLAHLDPKFIFGALYLFVINSIFIALATFLVAKYLRFPSVFAEDEVRRRRSRRIIWATLILILVPSVYSAFLIVRETNFERNVEALVERNKTVGRSYIFNYDIEKDGKNHSVQLYVAGEVLPDAEKESIYQDAEELGIKRNQLTFHEDAAVRGGLDGELLKNFYEDNTRKMQEMDATVKNLESELDAYKAKELPSKVLALEIASQYDNISNVSVSRGESVNPLTGESAEDIVIILSVTEPLADEALDKMTNWLRVRLETSNVTILQKQIPDQVGQDN